MGTQSLQGQPALKNWLRQNLFTIVLVAFLLVAPFLLAIAYGDSISALLVNQAGNSKFYQGLLIEIFILAVFAISYDLVFGITGLLSFGHAMFFAVGAYLTGFFLKTMSWSLWATASVAG